MQSSTKGLATLLLAGVAVAWFAQKKGQGMQSYFSDNEFNGFADQLAPGLRDKLNAFRAAWGAPVSVSQASGAVGRHAGQSGTQHNLDRWGFTRAVDVFPQGMDSAEDRARALLLAKQAGFTGVGLYLDTNRPMLHVDVRPGNRVATWARVEGEYMGIGAALA